MSACITTATTETMPQLQKCFNDCIDACIKNGCNNKSAIRIVGKMISGEPFLLNESWNGDIDNAKIFYNWKRTQLRRFKNYQIASEFGLQNGLKKMDFGNYHSYPQLLQWNWCFTFCEKMPNRPTLTALAPAEIFFTLVLLQVGQWGRGTGSEKRRGLDSHSMRCALAARLNTSLW